MKKIIRFRLRLLAIVLSSVVCVLVAAFSVGLFVDREPIYKGRTLSEWVEQLRQFDGNHGFHPPADDLSVIALHSIGQQSVPYLIKWISTPQSDINPAPEPATMLTEVRRKFIKFYSHYAKHSPPSRSDAVFAFWVLGREARSAIPELANLANNAVHLVMATNGPHNTQADATLRYTVRALAGLGPDAAPVLLNVATNLQGYQYQWTVIEDLGMMKSNGLVAIPALINWTHDHSPIVRARACYSLGKIKAAPKDVIPVLRSSLNDPDTRVRDAAESALNSYGDH